MGSGIKEGWREGKVREKCNYTIVPKIKVKKNVERQRKKNDIFLSNFHL